MRYLSAALAACVLSATLAAQAAAQSPPEAPARLPAVEVVGTTPLPGFGVPLRDVPANVQTFGSGDLLRQRPPTLVQFLDGNANSVAATSGQGNPFEQALLFRGFAASPLLGTPQGLSVFQDGVRINEAFGDVVNWDLLPRSAIAGVQLIPGSVPSFGLNTLGGALAIVTKDGAHFPGASLEAQAGSFGARGAQVEYGGRSGSIDGFATAAFSADRGWAQHNPSRIAQFFGKLRHANADTDASLSLTLADNRLEGTQTLPLSFLDTPRQAYTFPDRNENRLAFLAARLDRNLSANALLSANAYARSYRTRNFSSNVNEAFGDPSGDSPDNPGTNDVSRIDQRTWGGGVQLAVQGRVMGIPQHFIAGLSGDFGATRFSQETQPADFGADRGTQSTGPFRTETDVDLRNAYTGAYFSNTAAMAPDWSVTVSGRYNHARVAITDRSGGDPALDGTHAFSRFNPAIGATYHPTAAFTAYSAYNEGMRAPTPVELTCADPNAPCKLPNQFLADPTLHKVVARTLEAGVRGRAFDTVNYALAVYRTDLVDDIQFIASGTTSTNAGYFQNVGRTRRQGFEAMAGWPLGPVQFTLRYNHLDARFRTPFRAASPNNSSADESGAIDVVPGNRIPGIATDSLKLRAEWRASDTLQVAGNVLATSSQYALGDDNNADRQGRVPGYAVVNLDARLQLTPRLQLFGQLVNAFDRRYATLGLLGANAFVARDRGFGPAAGIPAVPEQFRAIAAPRAVQVGLRWDLESPQ